MKKIEIEEAKRIMFEYIKMYEEKLNPRYALEKRQTPEMLEPKHTYKYISVALGVGSHEEDYFVFPLLYLTHTSEGLEECLMTGVLHRIVDRETGAVIRPDISSTQSTSDYLKDLKSSGRLLEVALYLPYK